MDQLNAPTAAQNNQGVFAVKVRSRAELSVTDVLRKKGFSVLLPTYIEHKQYTDRIKKASQPLFPGYVFVNLHSQELLELLTTDNVSYIVKHGSTLQPLPSSETKVLNALCGFIGNCEPCENFEIGQRVRIQSGPLKDQTGILTRVGGKDRVVVHINSIFSSVIIDLKDTPVSALIA